MTFLIKLENQTPVAYPVTKENFLSLFPRTSFPAFLSPDDIEPFGYGLYDFSSQPELGRHEKAVEIAPERNSYGIWQQTWAVEEINAEEKAEADEEKSANVRAERNYKLQLCDWTQLGDSPLSQSDKEAWTAYRQDLRNVPRQEGFPWDVIWHQEP